MANTIDRREDLDQEERERFLEEVGQSVLETFPFEDPLLKGEFSNKFRALFANIPANDNALIEEIRKLLNSLNSTHLALENQKKSEYILDQSFFYADGQVWISQNKVAKRIIRINDEPVEEIIQKRLKTCEGGTMGYRMQNILSDLRRSKQPGSMPIAVENKGSPETIEIPFVTTRGQKDERQNPVFFEILEGGLAYLRITGWSNYVSQDKKSIPTMIIDLLPQLLASKGIIFDVRNNSGGDSRLAEPLARHFIKHSQSFAQIYIKVPGKDNLRKHDCVIDPLKPTLGQPTVLLTNSKCLSSNEMFILMLKDTGHAITIGETTGGGSRNPKLTEISLGSRKFTLHVPTWKMVRNNGQELENIGITPDIEVVPTPQDIAIGKDPVLERAIHHLKEKH